MSSKSLYDLYHSIDNVNFLYNYLNNIFENKMNLSIKNNINYYNFFNNYLKEFFIKSKSETLKELNHELLKNVVVELLKIIKDDNNEKNDKIMKETKLESLSTNNEINKSNPDVINNKEIDNTDVIDKYNTLVSNNNYDNNSVNSVNNNSINNNIIQIDNLKIKEDTAVNSNNRIDKSVNSNLYYFKVNINNIKKLSKIIINILDNELFTMPIIKLKIEELNILVDMKLNKTYSIRDYVYGEYIPIKDTYIDKDVNEITIQLFNIISNNVITNHIFNIDIYKEENNYKFSKNNLLIKKGDIINIFNDNFNYYSKIINIDDEYYYIDNTNIINENKVNILNTHINNTIIFST